MGQVVHLYGEKESPKYERAALRWLERYLTESSLSLENFAKVTWTLRRLGRGLRAKEPGCRVQGCPCLAIADDVHRHGEGEHEAEEHDPPSVRAQARQPIEPPLCAENQDEHRIQEHPDEEQGCGTHNEDHEPDVAQRIRLTGLGQPEPARASRRLSTRPCAPPAPAHNASALAPSSLSEQRPRSAASVSFVAMVAAMATLTGSAANLAAITELSGDVGEWLRRYDGYRGVFVFVDENEKTSRVITLWETAKDELAARQARGAMRDQLMAMAGLEVVSFDVYDVPGHEYVAG
jgi:hypothetical protein